MTKVVKVSSLDKRVTVKRDFENVFVVAEGSPATAYKSAAEKMANLIKDSLKGCVKDGEKFEVIVISDEHYDSYTIKKILVLFDTPQEKFYDVMDSTTEMLKMTLGTLVVNQIEFGMLEDGVDEKYPSYFELRCQDWADEIQKYLANAYHFHGVTKINASFWKKLQSFDITISGKGTTDKIFEGAKRLSEIILSKEEIFNTDNKYKYISNWL